MNRKWKEQHETCRPFRREVSRAGWILKALIMWGITLLFIPPKQASIKPKSLKKAICVIVTKCSKQLDNDNDFHSHQRVCDITPLPSKKP